MKQVKIDGNSFKHLMDAVKYQASDDEWRPELQHIKLVVMPTGITAYATNGWAANMAQLPMKILIEDKFECYIKPLAIKNQKCDVLIDADDEYCHVNIISKNGKFNHAFAQKKIATKYPNLEQLFIKCSEETKTCTLNPKFLINSMKAISSVGNGTLATFAFSDTPTAPVLIRSTNRNNNDSIKVAQMLCQAKL